MAWFGYALSALGTATSMAGNQENAENIKKANLRAAIKLEKKADNAIGIGQRKMLRERRNKELVASRALALAAASGADVSSPGIVDILVDIEGEGTYRESVALYEGEQEAAAMREEAQNLREGVRAVESAARTQTLSTALQGASSIYGMSRSGFSGGSASGGGYGAGAGVSAGGYTVGSYGAGAGGRVGGYG